MSNFDEIKKIDKEKENREEHREEKRLQAEKKVQQQISSYERMIIETLDQFGKEVYGFRTVRQLMKKKVLFWTKEHWQEIQEKAYKIGKAMYIDRWCITDNRGTIKNKGEYFVKIESDTSDGIKNLTGYLVVGTFEYDDAYEQTNYHNKISILADKNELEKALVQVYKNHNL